MARLAVAFEELRAENRVAFKEQRAEIEEMRTENRAWAEKMHDKATGMAVIVEQMQEQNRVTMDALLGLQRRMTAGFSESRAEMKEQFDIHGVAIQQNSVAIQQNSVAIQQNTEDIQDLKEVVTRIEKKLDRKADVETVEQLEQRVSVLENVPV